MTVYEPTFAIRKYAREKVNEDPTSENLHAALSDLGEQEVMERLTGDRAFRQKVVMAMYRDFQEMHEKAMKREEEMSQKEQDEKLFEILRLASEGKDPREAFNEEDRKHMESVAKLTVMHEALKEFEVHWQTAMN